MLDYRVRTFLAVYRAGSYTGAAAELHVTQPAVSQHVRQLEERYGCPLFERRGRGVAPTPQGERAYRALSVMENDEERLAAELARMGPAAGGGRLVFGCTRTVADFWAPRVLAGHLARHPGDRVRMRTGNTRELMRLIDGGAIDFALVEGSFDRGLYEGSRVSSEPFVAVGAPGLRPAPSLDGLLAHRLILREEGSGTRQILERQLAARERGTGDFAGTIELASIPAIKACARSGAGISFMYRIAVEAELGRGELADITPPDFRVVHDFTLVWQRGSRYAARWRALARAWGR